MSERFPTDLPDFRVPDLIEIFRPLPNWLAQRLLRSNEKVTWVRGPWFNPSWERYITHPALILFVLAPGALCLAFGWLNQVDPGVLVFGAFFYFVAFGVPTIIVLGIANGYFTRLVVTNYRLVILQGYEICRSWSIDYLPPSLLRYGKRGEEESRTIDVDVVKTMLGGPSDKFADAKTILNFGKQLDSITLHDKDRH
jgi:hypothetical protein